MILDLIKKSQNNIIWNFLNKNLFNVNLKKFLYPSIFIHKFQKLNINTEELYTYAREFPNTKWQKDKEAYQSNHDLQDNKIFIHTKKEIESFLNKSIRPFFVKKSLIGKFKIKSLWFVIMKKNTFHHMHFHPKSTLSGVIYLKKENNKNGKLKILIPKKNIEEYRHQNITNFLNHNPNLIDLRKNEDNHSVIEDSVFEFNPQINEMIIFNSYFYHWVDEYNDLSDRISIAWDAVYTL